MARLRNRSRDHDPAKARRAQRLRRKMGASERLLYESLRAKNSGFAFRRQYPILGYVLDFYCPEAMLCVEVDGECHAFRAEADAKRDMVLSNVGVKTIRVPSLDLFEVNHVAVVRWAETVIGECERRSGRKGWQS